IIPAMILRAIEDRTKRSVASMFDLMAGTSTGGIISLMLNLDGGSGAPKYRATDLVDLYVQRGTDIFPRSLWQGVSSAAGLTEEKYPVEPLEAILKEYLGDALLEQAITRVLVSSYEIETRRPFFFKSWWDETKSAMMRQAARATSAAPTYFQPALMLLGDKKLWLIDGGVFVNNPAMSAYAEARRLFPDERDFLVVSLGTGQLIRPIHYEEARDWGKVQWALPILNVVFDGVSSAVDYQLQQVLGDNFIRFQTTLDTANDDMDDASPANLAALKIEANRIVEAQADDIEKVCRLLAQP
ncbi:MAG: patatin-like phospholipase family protein, partial [Desulfobaccales bacterium]